MKKQTIRLSEAQLHRVIKESVNKVLSELDWKTYANAARKSKERGDSFDRYYNFGKAANDAFNDEYVGDYKHDTLGDKLRGNKSPRFDAFFHPNRDKFAYGAVTGYNKGGDKIFATEKGTYHSHNGLQKPGSFFRNKEVADAFEKANDELFDYENGNYEYQKGKGWKMKK